MTADRTTSPLLHVDKVSAEERATRRWARARCAHDILLTEACLPCGFGPLPEGFEWGRDLPEESAALPERQAE